MKNEQFLGMPESTGGGIYMLLNTNNHRIYIGKTSDFHERARAHFYQLRSGTHPNKEMQADFNEGCGFIFSILENMDSDPENMSLRENQYIFAFLYRYINLYNHETREQIGKRLFWDMVSPVSDKIHSDFQKRYKMPMASIRMCSLKTLKEKFIGNTTGETKRINKPSKVKCTVKPVHQKRKVY